MHGNAHTMGSMPCKFNYMLRIPQVHVHVHVHQCAIYFCQVDTAKKYKIEFYYGHTNPLVVMAHYNYGNKVVIEQINPSCLFIQQKAYKCIMCERLTAIQLCMYTYSWVNTDFFLMIKKYGVALHIKTDSHIECVHENLHEYNALSQSIVEDPTRKTKASPLA